MGGIIIMIALMIAFLKFSDKCSEYWALLTACLGFGLVGFLDDYIKIVFQTIAWFNSKQKLFGQLLFSAIVCCYAIQYGS